jgi:dethiobiotin synthetase
LVEGAGGWRLPVNIVNKKNTMLAGKDDKTEFLSDFVKQEQLDVILIVNMKLGCLNHALLTYETIKSDGVNCIAWIANNANVIPMNNLSENIQSLEELLPIPKLAQIDYIADINEQGIALSFIDKIKLASQSINTQLLTKA